ncbi:hypothetical protein OC846_000028 [Tilletia horrida]|uniref:MARVEL domain-containing protein n=1 Tax=Tilletia horrida TaxID=155126 RepID=A0AAN6GWB8_9BASI|nr:hypothetical protein OC845_001341 [Tilletia horrida]KAK0558036.1 hypothetical protein OC846_000028 [Tilletia horrida]KAK0569172.1 hypothetical protein OC861_001208 [Tilletia horrida]
MGAPTRYALDTPAPDRDRLPPAINPIVILVLRFFITLIVCGLALATCIMCLLVVVYYNTHDPIVRPSWGSLIFLIVLGFMTPIAYFNYNILMPLAPFIKWGDFLYGCMQARCELVFGFAMCVFWISGALAYASDLRGYENCQFDGYYHYPKPADFQHVCDLINWAVPLAYATFGMQTFLWVFEVAFGAYTFLYLDQDSLSEPHFEWGRRAYNYRYGKDVTPQSAYRARTGRGADDGEYVEEGETVAARGTGRRGAGYGAPTEPEMTQNAPSGLGARGRAGYGADAHEDEEGGWHLRQE